MPKVLDSEIAKMRNLGAKAAEDFAAVGIYKASQIKELGPIEAFHKMLIGREINGKPIACVNALYLYALYGAIYDIDWPKIPTAKKEEYKSYTKNMRHKKHVPQKTCV